MLHFINLFPVVAVVAILVNLVLSFMANNWAAVNAYIMALCGWLVLAYEGVLQYSAAKSANRRNG
jgi:hypothetical protein